MGHLTGVVRNADGCFFGARVPAAFTDRPPLESHTVPVDFASYAWVSFTCIGRSARLAAHAGVSNTCAIN